MGVPLRGIAARELAHQNALVGGRINAIHNTAPIYKTVAHCQVEIVFPSFGGVINAKVIVEVGVAELFAIESEQILAAVVALLVTGVKTEAASGRIPKTLHQSGEVFFTLYVFKAEANTKAVGNVNHARVVFKTDFGGIVILKPDKGVNDHYGNVIVVAVLYAVNQLAGYLLALVTGKPHMAHTAKRGVNGLINETETVGFECPFGGFGLIPTGEHAAPTNAL